MATPTHPTRTFGRSGRTVSPIGFGCWAIGGPAFREGHAIGWGKVDDDESVAAIHAALDAGITFFDTASIYGAGHSERVLGRALAGRWDNVVVATKFGNLFDEATKQATGRDASPASIRRQCDDSLARLGTDVIDLYQFHIGDYDPVRAEEVVATLDGLVAAGKIRSFGWSTDDPERAKVFARSPNCVAVQLRGNVLEDNPAMVELLEAENLAGIIRSPLAGSALTGKFTQTSTFADDDIRSHTWDFAGKQGRILDALDQIRDILTGGGRTLAQGALCWLLARSPAFVPIPGIRTVSQAKENAGAIGRGPLSDTEMSEIQTALKSLDTSQT
jgi:aryl-alcohol dehydrogenase-like predicted oxidoreductase